MISRIVATPILFFALLPLMFSGVKAAQGAIPTTAPSDDDIDNLPVKAPNVGAFTQRTTAGSRDCTALGLYLFSAGQAGATAKEHPTFYWYLSQQIDNDTEAVLAEVDATKPGAKAAPEKVIMRKKYTGTQLPGIYAATLDEASLEPDKLYKISVVVNLSTDTGVAKFASSMSYVVRQGATGAPADAADPTACAKAGLWYDAIDAAMRRIAHDSKDPAPHKVLHALLRGEHTLYTPGPSDKPGDNASAKQAEADLLKQLGESHDALLITKPPEKKPGRAG